MARAFACCHVACEAEVICLKVKIWALWSAHLDGILTSLLPSCVPSGELLNLPKPDILRECKLVLPLWRTVWRFLKKLKIELPCDPAIPLLGIYLEKILIRKGREFPRSPVVRTRHFHCGGPRFNPWKGTRTIMFIAALLTTAKTWKQPKCPWTEDWIKKRRYIYIYIYIYIWNGILLSHKKEQNNAICRNVDGPRDYHTKWSKSERERQILHDITYMWNLKYDTKELIYERETDSDIENKLMVTKGERVWGRDKLGVWD